MASNTSPRKYFPGPFADPELNTAIQTAYQLIYACVAAAQGNLAMDSGSSLVTGSLLRIQTKLSSVTNVVVSIDNGDQSFTDLVGARPTPQGKGGQIDIFVWASGGGPSATQRRVRWVAMGAQ